MLINNFVKKYSIYAIKCNKTNNVYVGSTSNLLNRLGNHISSYKKGKSKCTSRFVLALNDFTCEVIMDNLTKDEAKATEYHFIEGYGKLCVNKNKPVLCDIKEYQKVYQKEYRDRKNAISVYE